MSLRYGIARAGRHVRSSPRVLPLAHNKRAAWTWSFLGNQIPNPADSGQQPSHFTPSKVKTAQKQHEHGPTDRQTLVHHFNNAIGMNNPAALHRWYRSIRDVLDHTPQPQPWLTRPQLLNALALLALTSRSFSRNADLIDTILHDMPTLHHEPVTEDVHLRILDGLLRASTNTSLEVPHQYVYTMQERPGSIAPTVNMWNTLIAYCSQRNMVSRIRRILSDMIVTGCLPTLVSYELLFKAVGSSFHLLTTEEATDVAEQMVSIDLPYDPATWSILQEAYVKEDYRVLSDDITDIYERAYAGRTAPNSTEPTPIGLSQELTRCAMKDGVQAALHLFNQKRITDGLKPNYDVLAAILRGSHKLTEMRRAERALNLRAGPNARVWMLLIKNADAKGYAHNAVEVYQQARRAGVPLTATLATPVVHALCGKVGASGAVEAGEDALDTALEIYAELCAAQVRGGGDAGGPSASLYRVLVRTLAHAPNQRKYAPKLLDVLDEMKARKFPPDASVLAMIVASRMRAAPTLEDAHAAYAHLTRGHAPLDAAGYMHVVLQLCDARADADAPPAIGLVFDVVADARAAGHDIAERAYIAWLRAVGQLATAARGDDPRGVLEALQLAIQRVHDRLTLDATVTPTAFLWSALMNAYQRAGMTRDALRVWDMMLLQGQLNDAAVSIMTDTCSYAGIHSLMQDIWARLLRTRFPLNQRHWNNYVEAMCRLNKLDRAVAVVCGEMDAQRDPHISPNVDSIAILFKYAKAHGRFEEVESVIQSRLPSVYKQYQST